MADFTVVASPDEFTIVDKTDDWVIFTQQQAEFTLEFVAVSMNDAALVVAAKDAAIAAQVAAEAAAASVGTSVEDAEAAAAAAAASASSASTSEGNAEVSASTAGDAAVAAQNAQAAAEAAVASIGTAVTDAQVAAAASAASAATALGAETGAQAAQVAAEAAAALATSVIPTGGLTGEVLVKASNADYDYAWAAAGGIGDMTKAVYDPGNIAANVFARANHTGTQLAATISDFSTAADARVSAAIGVTAQAYDAGLAALAVFNTNGIIVQTADNTFAGRTLTGPAAGISVSNGNGVSGNPTLALANDLSALEALSSTGLAARTGTDAWAQRTITGTSGRIGVTNGSGASGNPTIDLAAAADVRDYLDATGYVATRTAMKALDTTKETVCFLIESGRQGIFLWTTGNFSTHHAADTLEGVYVKATAIASTAGSWVRLANQLTPQMFGALGNGVANDTPAFAAFQTIVMLTGIPGFIPDGDYACADNLSWDFTTPPNTYQNIEIRGAGIERAKLTFAATKTFKITNTDASNAAFYKRISGFQAIGNVAGVFGYIGATTLAAAFNWIDSEHVHFTNTSSNAANIAVKIEKCYGCHISVVASCAAGLGTNGCAIQIVDSNFCTFKLFPGSALYGLQLYSIDAVCSGNVFLANDYEVNGTGIYIDTAGVTDNTWIGGVIAYNEAGDYGISASAGARNRFIGVHHGGSGNLFNGDVGIEFNPTIDKLQSNRTYYVRSDGSDTANDGRANTAARAFLTRQKALNVISTLDLNGFDAIIQVQDGTVTTSATMINKPLGAGRVILRGNLATPANVIWNVTSGHDLYVSNGVKITIEGMELRTTTSGNCLVADGDGSEITIGASMRFGASAGAHCNAFGGGKIYGRTSYSVVGSAVYHWLSQVGSKLDVQGITLTLTGTPNFTGSFVRADSGALVAAGFNTFSGSATGVRSATAGGGVIDSNGGSETYFPGNSGGFAPIGYQAGVGGAITQITSKATGVTLNKVCGQITTHNAALAAAAEVSFTVTNSAVAATDVVVASIASGATAGAYVVQVDAVAAGSFRVSISNQSAGSLGEALVINFVVLKAVAA